MTLLDGDPRSIGGYQLQGRLGAGGMGVVYRASSLSGRQVAVKVIRPELAQDPGFRDRFRREVAAARQVSGAFTAPVVDADAEAETPWLATLFVPGPSLAERVIQQGPLPVSEVRRLAAGLVEALREIHRVGLIHRDLKPGNVLLAHDGPRVIDFGIARVTDATPLTSTGVAIGTPPFMAPEQFRRGTVSAATDVFSLGSVLVYAATGHGPFDGDHTHAIGFRVVYEEPDLDGLAPELHSLVLPCLDKDAGQRPTLEVLLRALVEAGQSGEPQSSAPPVPSVLPPATPPPTVPPTVPPVPEAGAPDAHGTQDTGAPTTGPDSEPNADADTGAGAKTNSAPTPAPTPTPTSAPNSPSDSGDFVLQAPRSPETNTAVPKAAGFPAPADAIPHPGRELPSSAGELTAPPTVPPDLLGPLSGRPGGSGSGGGGGSGGGKRGISARALIALAVSAAMLTAGVVSVRLLNDDSGDGGKEPEGKNSGSPTASSSPGTGDGPVQSLGCPKNAPPLRGDGSTMQKAALDRWMSDYIKDCPKDQIIYDGQGVGAGIQAFAENRTSFAVTDSVLTPDDADKISEKQCSNGGPIHLPLSTSPTAVVVNLPEAEHTLALTASIIALIYKGEITRWNDPRIVGMNPGEDMPDKAIVPIHVSSFAGSTLSFSKYLAKAAPEDWTYEPSTKMPIQEGQSAQTSQQLGTLVKETDGALGYVPMGYATDMGLTPVGLSQGGNDMVTPTEATVLNGARAARLRGTDDDLALEVNYRDTQGSRAYPMIEFGYAVVCSRDNGEKVADILRAFLSRAVSEKGQRAATELGYGALPEELTSKVLDVLRKLT
ncbi:serine/threonine-protein kinase [Streptomyces sp. NA04227]|uniref:serine/threonine-protein kinase n=1 Tax=Streptomyces sp. NA04227 TaxID=2742136 RepID=UPI0026E0D493|nr:serine/threonine-protein kinase [Streptomyces sp. NA04227]